jgi:hypothetical protein
VDTIPLHVWKTPIERSNTRQGVHNVGDAAFTWVLQRWALRQRKGFQSFCVTYKHSYTLTYPPLKNFWPQDVVPLTSARHFRRPPVAALLGGLALAHTRQALDTPTHVSQGNRQTGNLRPPEPERQKEQKPRPCKTHSNEQSGASCTYVSSCIGIAG